VFRLLNVSHSCNWASSTVLTGRTRYCSQSEQSFLPDQLVLGILSRAHLASGKTSLLLANASAERVSRSELGV
jgi:hypothetical protein